jgi:hypothetical protein
MSESSIAPAATVMKFPVKRYSKTHVCAAPIACAVPIEWSLHRGARVAGSVQEIERNTNDSSLHHRIIRLTARVAEGEVSEHEAGNAALLDDIPRRANYDCRNAVRLKVSSDQTHGLMADRSERYEKRNIDRVCATEVEDCGGIRVDGPPLAEVRRHAVEAGRETANAADRRELRNPSDR